MSNLIWILVTELAPPTQTPSPTQLPGLDTTGSAASSTPTVDAAVDADQAAGLAGFGSPGSTGDGCSGGSPRSSGDQAAGVRVRE